MQHYDTVLWVQVYLHQSDSSTGTSGTVNIDNNNNMLSCIWTARVCVCRSAVYKSNDSWYR